MKMRVNCRVALTAILLLASARPCDAIGFGKQEGSPKAAKEAKPPHGMGVPEDRLDLGGEWTMQSSFLEKDAWPTILAVRVCLLLQTPTFCTLTDDSSVRS
jgi:hypothetical protein